MFWKEFLDVIDSISKYQDSILCNKWNEFDIMEFELKNLNDSNNKIKLIISNEKKNNRFELVERIYKNNVLINENKKIFSNFDKFLEFMNNEYKLLLDIKENKKEEDKEKIRKEKDYEFHVKITSSKLPSVTQWAIIKSIELFDHDFDNFLQKIENKTLNEIRWLWKKWIESIEKEFKRELNNYIKRKNLKNTF